MNQHAWQHADDDPWSRWITRVTIALAVAVRVRPLPEAINTSRGITLIRPYRPRFDLA